MALSWLPLDVDDEDPLAPRWDGDPAELVDAMAELLELARRPAWHASAACRGMSTASFYPGQGGDLDEARAVCGGCPVRQECLGAALDLPAVGDFGVWGGTSERQRRQLRRTAA